MSTVGLESEAVLLWRQEVKVVTVQGGVKRAAAETLSKEKRLRIREQGLIDSANDLQVVYQPGLLVQR